MATLDQLLADLGRIADCCNRFEHPDLQVAAFNMLTACVDTPPKPEQLAVNRHRADNAPTALIPTIRP